MKVPKPLTLYFSDRGEPEFYNLTFAQIEVFQANDWEGIEKFKVDIPQNLDVGYAPYWLVALGEMYGFEVESI